MLGVSGNRFGLWIAKCNVEACGGSLSVVLTQAREASLDFTFLSPRGEPILWQDCIEDGLGTNVPSRNRAALHEAVAQLRGVVRPQGGSQLQLLWFMWPVHRDYD